MELAVCSECCLLAYQVYNIIDIVFLWLSGRALQKVVGSIPRNTHTDKKCIA